MKISSVSSKKKIDKIVETGKKLFYRYGIKKVSVEEICKEAGVSKATFYKYFKNKVDLALFILREIFDNAWKEYYDIVIKELVNSDVKEIRDYINQEIQKSYRESKNFYLLGKKEGYIREDVDIDFLFSVFSKTYDLFADEELTKKYQSPGVLFEQIVKLIMYGICTDKARR